MVATINFKEETINGFLAGLGKVNAICGQNNSGKSYLLKRIASKTNRIVDIRIGIDQVRELSFDEKSSVTFSKRIRVNNEALLTSSGLSSVSVKHLYKAKDLLEKYIIENGDIKWEAQSDKLVEKIVRYFHGTDDAIPIYQHKDRIDALISNSFTDMTVQALINKLEKEYRFSGIIEAKRHVTTKDSISPEDKQTKFNDPLHLVDVLFKLKNSVPNSQDRIAFERIQSSFVDIVNDTDFDISHIGGGQVALYFKNSSGGWYDADESGIGLRDLLFIVTNCYLTKNDVILIEEPENHIHPAWQRKLLHFLKFKVKPQVIYTTHSSTLLDTSFVDTIFMTKQINGCIHITKVNDKAIALHDLGYLTSDNLLSEVVVLVEGKTDVPVIEEFINTAGIDNSDQIKVISFGHINGLSDVNYNTFCKSYRAVIVVVDGDDNKESRKARAIIGRKIEGVPNASLCKLDGYGIENYFSVEALTKFFEKGLPDILRESIVDGKLPLKCKIKGLKKNENNYRVVANYMKKEEILAFEDIHQNLIEVIKRRLL
ncbi:putative ATP-dependent endonuclease of OLD family [Lewinella aquimaris]|uniref:Putative ATP-dependent endonuclease of OLD family n=1 Tax=Neolewinella aquimaris TaxID=1835722 RepID=A0A840EH24_9BACT|nr:ATP-binding protein [Neolewinella aquimaris]MBB4081109.1 putative ATP-dependent endonuclease of OLD family [Neolewinella aquimaris]